MSGVHSTSTERTCSVFAQDLLSNQRAREPQQQCDSAGLVQRCVIIQRDYMGFGLTLSGDNPVFVQLVREDGAAMRAGVQTGDRIIKVNGTLVTHSNHLEVVKLIKSGSYVALTVLGRPPGSTNIPLSKGGAQAHPPGKKMADCAFQDQDTAELLSPLGTVEGVALTTPPQPSPGVMPRGSTASSLLTEGQDVSHLPCDGHPPSWSALQIIGAEDDYFEAEKEQISGQCSAFQSMELLRSRPAHLAVFLHHVFSQFDPAPLLCYLYTDLYQQTNSKETRRVFMELHTLFMEHGATLRVTVPESITFELDRRRPELIPEELHRQYIQHLQESLLPEMEKHLADFRQKRSMGLTLVEDELMQLHVAQGAERERACAEAVLAKVEDMLLTMHATEEEKSTSMHYVLLTYMKHLGVKVKEHPGLEPRRIRLNFLPKMKKRMEREVEEKVKKGRFPSILSGPQRKPGSSGRVTDSSPKPRPQKQPSQCVPDVAEGSQCGRLRGVLASEGPELPATPALKAGARDSDATFWKTADGVSCGDSSNVAYGPTSHFSVDQLQEDEQDSDRMEMVGAAEFHSEDDQGGEVDSESRTPNWQQLVGREVLDGLTPREIKRQEVINELFYTERAHLHMLKVMDTVFYQKMSKDAILPPADIKTIFANLEEIIQLHASITEQITAIRKQKEISVIDRIGNELLSWFGGVEEDKIKRAVGTFCSNQPFALELIKSRQKRDHRFAAAVQEAESSPLCRRLQLKDIIPVEMQRLTKYPLLLENIAKCTEDHEEKEKVSRAGECCRHILNHVNQAVKEAENEQRLEDYQRRLDVSSLKQNENPMISELKNLDLTTRKMLHEGPLSWKVNKDKTIELYALLLDDILVLLQKQDDRLVLRSHSKNLSGSADTKHTFSPVIKLSTVLLRSVATDNRSFFVLSMSDNGAQIYELMAQTVSEQKIWQHQITQAADSLKTKPLSVIPLPQSDVVRDVADIVGTNNLASDCSFSASVSVPDRDANFLHPEPGPYKEGNMGDEEESFFDSGVADRRAPGQTRSRSCVAHSPSPCIAEEALQNLNALRKLLDLQLAQDHSEGKGLHRNTSLRVWPTVPLSSIHNGQEERLRGSGSLEPRSSNASEDSGYLILEGFGDPAESSTDGEAPVSPRERMWSSPANLQQPVSPVATGGTADLHHQVLPYLHSLQISLQQLKNVERKYQILYERSRKAQISTDENEDKG